MALGEVRTQENPSFEGRDARTIRSDVEGLRAIAIVTVVLYHFQLPPFRGGYIGVDVFFVISGFVITAMLLRERDTTSRTSLVGFYARRIRRILPAASLTIVATVVTTYFVLGAVSSISVAHDAFAAALFVANVHFAHQANNYLLAAAPASPLVHFWSLSIEEQFYFVWPSLFSLTVIVAGAKARRHVLAALLILIVIGSLVYSYVATNANSTSAYYSSLARAGELALGALVAVGAPWCRRIPTPVATVVSWLGLGGILACAVIYNDHTRFPGLAVIVPITATAAVIAAGFSQPDGGAGALLSRRALTAVGALSFSLYLWHWPVFSIVSQRLGHTPSWLWRVALLVPVAILAVTSYRWVETPIRRSPALAKRPGRTYLLGAGVVALTLAVIFTTLAVGNARATSWPTPTPPDSTTALNAVLSRSSQINTLPALVVPLSRLGNDIPSAGFDRGCLVAFDAATALGSRPADCYFGDVASARTLVLYGDSNADMWIATFDALGRRDHFRVALLARASCQVADLHLWNPALHAPGTACSEFRDWAMTEITRLHPFTTVVADYEYGLRWDYRNRPVPADVATAGVTRTIHTIHSSTAAPVVMLSMPPAVFADPPQCLSLHSSNIQVCGSPVYCQSAAGQAGSACAFDPASGRTWSLVRRLPAAVAAAGGTYVDITTLFCSPTACAPVVNHIVVNFDLRHVSMHYSVYVSNTLGVLMKRAGAPLNGQ